MSTSIHDHTITLNTGQSKPLSDYSGSVLLIVNTASKCGFTPQYEGLEALYQKYQDEGFAVIGFPCNQFGNQEPASNDEVRQFCSLNYNISFPLSEKVDVNGDDTTELYKTLKREAPGVLGSQRIKWNFTKFLVGRDGKVIERYAPTTKPEALSSAIESALFIK